MAKARRWLGLDLTDRSAESIRGTAASAEWGQVCADFVPDFGLASGSSVLAHRSANVVEREESSLPGPHGPQNGAATPAFGNAERMDADGSCTSGKLDAKDQEADVLVLGVVS